MGDVMSTIASVQDLNPCCEDNVSQREELSQGPQVYVYKPSRWDARNYTSVEASISPTACDSSGNPNKENETSSEIIQVRNGSPVAEAFLRTVSPRGHIMDQPIREAANYMMLSAARKGDGECIRSLLGCEVNTIDSVDEWGRSALHFASWVGAVDICKILLNAGASIDLKTKDGRTALDVAVDADRRDVIDLFKSVHDVKDQMLASDPQAFIATSPPNKTASVSKQIEQHSMITQTWGKKDDTIDRIRTLKNRMRRQPF